MKLFLDTAHIPSIETWVNRMIIDGVTTNPTLLSKEQGEPKMVVQEICALLPHGVVSLEVTEQEPEKVYQQALALAAIAKNVVVKIPCHVRYYEVIARLVAQHIPLNITLVFSVVQSLMMCKLGVRYISPFVGRLDDSGESGIEVVREICAMIDTYAFATEVIVASVRSDEHFRQAIEIGAHVITVPPALLEQVVQHTLTDSGMEKFLHDWKKLGLTQFP